MAWQRATLSRAVFTSRAHVNIGGRRLGSGTLDAKAGDDRIARGLLIAQIY
jgi:hypothetical protein